MIVAHRRAMPLGGGCLVGVECRHRVCSQCGAGHLVVVVNGSGMCERCEEHVSDGHEARVWEYMEESGVRVVWVCHGGSDMRRYRVRERGRFA